MLCLVLCFFVVRLMLRLNGMTVWRRFAARVSASSSSTRSARVIVFFMDFVLYGVNLRELLFLMIMCLCL